MTSPSTSSNVLTVEAVRSRTALHLWIVAGAVGAVLIYGILERFIMGFSFEGTVGSQLTATSIFALGALALRWRRLDFISINAVGIGALVLGCASLAGISCHIPRELRPELGLLFGFTLVFMSRSAVVPERPRTTLIVASLLAIPLGHASYTVYIGYIPPPDYVPLTSAKVTMFVLSMWTVVTLAGVAVSATIYGLRREVSKAQQLGQYILEERLGSGGMGTVFRARHGLLQRPTAVKLIHPENAADPCLRTRFEHEVKLTAQLSHPNTITVYDFGRSADGVFYYAMELLDGASLDDVVSIDGPMEPGRVIHVMQQVCGALREAHGQKLIHRDIKPANIMLARLGGVHDVAKVLDFGLVKHVSNDDPSLTIAGTMVGTPHYMSPEAISRPDSVDVRSDIYALGAVMYFLLTGKTVFQGDSAMDVCASHLRAEPKPLSACEGVNVPPSLDELVLRCLAKSPEERPQGAEEVLEALGEIAVGERWGPHLAEEWWDEYKPALELRWQEGRESLISATLIAAKRFVA